MKIKIFAVFLLFYFCTLSKAQPLNMAVTSGFNGVWVGESKNINGPNLIERKPDETAKFKLELQGSNGFVSYYSSDKWIRFWGGSGTPFYVVQSDTNAVVFQTASARDSNCLWVETWSFNLTKIETDIIRAFYYRTVNNRECKSKDDGIFTIAGTIDLRREK